MWKILQLRRTNHYFLIYFWLSPECLRVFVAKDIWKCENSIIFPSLDMDAFFFFEWPFLFWLKNCFRYHFIVLVTNPKQIFGWSTYYYKNLSFSSHHDWVILWAVMLKRSFLLLLAPWSIFLSMRWLELDKYIPTFNILKIEPLCWWLRAFWRAFKSWFCWSNMALRRSPEGFFDIYSYNWPILYKS